MEDVDQIAMGCETDGAAGWATTAEMDRPFEARPLSAGETAAVMERVRPWYGPDGAGIAARFTEPGRVEIFGAFEGEAPVAIALLMIDGEWAYLGGAGTDPTKRGRGAQTELIRARVRRAADLGVRWCAAETNTAVETSLRNLRRRGFRDVLVWRVWRWDRDER
jgi:GNAT superfamily N-acetyltransferase